MERFQSRLASKSISTIDFDLTIVIRNLYLCSQDLCNPTITLLQDLYDQGDLRFWISDGETLFVYWTENHLIMWLAATWLLRPFISFRENDNALLKLEQRLLHFLDTTLEYGAREFFSTN